MAEATRADVPVLAALQARARSFHGVEFACGEGRLLRADPPRGLEG